MSSANEGVGSVTVELESDADIKTVHNDIKTEVDLITTFPEDAEEPVVVEIINRKPAITVAVYGDLDERILREVAGQDKRRSDGRRTHFQCGIARRQGLRDIRGSFRRKLKEIRHFIRLCCKRR